MTAATTTVQNGCPRCGTTLTTAPEQAPWCAAFEWNLDNFPPDEHANWIWNRIDRANRRTGFASDRLLTLSTDPEPLRPTPDVVLFTLGWDAFVTVTGPRPRRVLVLGAQLLLALRAEEVVALLGHELGHLAYADNRRLLLTMPARLTFGRLSELLRPPRVSAQELGPSPELIWLTLWQLTAGTTPALRMIDTLATLPLLPGYVQHHVPKGDAATTRRRMLRAVQDREPATAPARRQLSIRTQASLFASHPAPGRRHEWLDGRPHREAAVVVTETESDLLEREVTPYAEALHRTMLKQIVHD
ncbi:M48 family metalloprotease [Actinoplanes sp. NPDC049596]|uniref:M48 family metalloprotease n=1 Tax=unclassified Actinoplanes TaxID=2626549 RepID=UPI0034335E05